MMVGIFESPLICSGAGNLQNEQEKQSLQAVQDHFNTPGYSFNVGYIPPRCYEMNQYLERSSPLFARLPTCTKYYYISCLYKRQALAFVEDHETLNKRLTWYDISLTLLNDIPGAF